MTGSRNSRWRSSKPEVPIFQLVEELETRFQIIIPCFRGREIQWIHSQHCHSTTEVGIQDGRYNNVSYHFRLGRTVFRYYRWIAGPQKYRFSRWNCVDIMCTSRDMSTSGLAAAILDLSLPVRSDSIVGITVGLLDPENIGLAVGIAMLLCVTYN